jgi:hypothetical protein
MDVIIDATNEERCEIVLPRYAAQVGPDALLNVRWQPGLAMFGAEDDVVTEAGKGIRHMRKGTLSRVATRRT